uniref:(northern house mosquito) hypothetical protein n=1 Tax=Culex pipiens TaxID=7175 RepID=A0A8D8BM30_CULPI
MASPRSSVCARCAAGRTRCSKTSAPSASWSWSRRRTLRRTPSTSRWPTTTCRCRADRTTTTTPTSSSSWTLRCARRSKPSGPVGATRPRTRNCPSCCTRRGWCFWVRRSAPCGHLGTKWPRRLWHKRRRFRPCRGRGLS